MATQIQLRRGTAAAWTTANTILAAGEEGYETDTGKRKVGDGTTAWASLAYVTSGHVIEDEGTPLTSRSKLNFIGAGVAATDNAGADSTDITISGTSASDASTTVKGVTKLATAPVSASAPIAVGDNDPRLSDTRTPADASVTVAKLAAGVLDTDGTLATNSDTRVPSQKAVKTYVDAHANASAVTKRVTQNLQVPGGTLQTNNFFDIVTRNLFLLPVTTTRWRLRFRNCSQLGVAALPSNAITIVGLALGDPVFPSSGLRWDGNMSNVVTALSNLTVPAGGAEYTSAWVTATNAQFKAGVMRAVSLGTLAASGTGTYNGGPGLSIRSTGGGNGHQASDQWNAAAALTHDDSITFALPNESSYDVRIEYEFATSTGTQVGLIIGDSLSVGAEDATAPDTNGMPQTHGVWPGRMMQRNGCVIVNVAVGGSTADQWDDNDAGTLAPPGFSWWIDRVDLATTVPDFVILFLGSNDINNLATATTVMTRLSNICAWVRATLGIQRIFVCTVPPRGFSGGKETARVALNGYIGEQELGSADVFDFDWVLRNPADFTTLTPDVTEGGGSIHPGPVGQARMASIVTIHQP